MDNPALHKRTATRNLRDAIENGSVSSKLFNGHQLKAIKSGKAEIPDFTWHHHQDLGRMQFLPREVHSKTGHIGGMDTVSKGGAK